MFSKPLKGSPVFDVKYTEGRSEWVRRFENLSKVSNSRKIFVWLAVLYSGNSK